MSDAVQIHFFPQLNNTPALRLAMQGWADVEARGFGDGTVNIFTDLSALVAYVQVDRDTVPVGVITFAVLSGKIWVYQGFVVEEHRGKGVYRKLWNGLVIHAMDKKVPVIESATHVRNAAMRAVAKRLGRQETHVVMRFEVPNDQ